MPWVRLPDESPGWFNLDRAHDIDITWHGDLHGPKTYVVAAHYNVNLRVVLHRTDTLDEAIQWIESLLNS
jgi:hypothetical protein